MNRQCYRLVFNKAKGRLIVASEAATSDRQDGSVTARRGVSPHASQCCHLLGRLRPLTWATLVALGLVVMPVAQAQILPDRNAPGAQRPHVVESANGTPQVNITSPNAKGVSRNAYRQFDVDAKGAILNNSRRNAQTQLGGWVQGNPNLASGEARVIVNEVNARHPSQLRGHVEVAGQRAEVVIANPAGIHVDGAGFINASGVALTTGTPEYRDGELAGYRVEEGRIQIAGAGLDTRDSDYTAILARAVEVQAGVWANDLEVVAGANRVSVDRQTITPVEGAGDAPAVAIDVAHLGGMYAGKIHLLATEDGVGVRHAGTLSASGPAAGAGEVVVSADGRIANRGKIAGEGDIRLASRTGIDNQGTLRAGGGIDIASRGTIANRGEGAIVARGDAHLQATGGQGRVRSEGDAVLAAGVRDDGRLGGSGRLTLEATQAIDAHGQNLAAGGVYAEADAVSLRGSQTQAREIDLVARDGGLDASNATLTAEERLSASTPATLRTDGARVQAGRLDITADGLSNRDGELVQSGDSLLSLDVKGLDNRDGRLASNGALEIDATTLTNRGGEIVTGGALDLAATGEIDNTQGRLEAADGLRLDIADTLVNAAGEIVQTGEGELSLTAGRLAGNGGLIASGGGLTLRAGEAVLDGATTHAERIDVQADRLSHRNGELLQLGDDGPLRLTLDGELDNTDGLIASNAALALAAGDLINHGGTLQAVGAADVIAASLDNRQGELLAGGSLRLAADGELDNAQGQLLADAIEITATAFDNRGGTVSAARDGLSVEVADLDNTEGRLEAAGDATLEAARTLTNERGDIIHAGAGELSLNSGRLEGSDGLIVSRGGLTLRADEAVLDGATTHAARIDVEANRLSHRQAEMFQSDAGGTLRLAVQRELDNASGLISSNADLALRAGDLLNQGGTLQAAGDAEVTATSLNNRQGELLSGSALLLEVGKALDNTQGQLLAQQTADVRAATLHNRNGTIGAVQGNLILDIAGATDNRAGYLEAGGRLALASRALDNRGGTLVGERLTLDTAGQHLNNTAGLIAARDTLDLTSGELDNTRGTLQAGSAATIDTQGQTLINADSGTTGGILATGALALTSGDLDNTGGLIGGNGLTIDAGTLTNRDGGSLLSEAALSLEAATLDNVRGQLQALGDMTLDVRDALRNQSGLVRAGGALAIAARHLVNRTTQGDEQGVEGQNVSIATDAVDNRQGTIRANQRLEIDAADSVDNRDGLLSSLHTLVLKTGELNNRDGTLIADRRLDLTTARLAEDGRVLSLGDLALRLASDFTLGAGGELMAQGDLLLTTTGTLTNRGTLKAGDTLDLTAGDIVNAVGGELSGTTTRLTAERLTNRGLIDGITTRIDAKTLDNLGSGRIYGDWLGIRANTLTNDRESGTSPVIAARERLDLGVGTLLNRDEALIFSAGDMAIGGRLDANDRAAGQATRLDNASATIEALGDLSLASRKINNTNTNFDTALVRVGEEAGRYLSTLSGSEKYSADDFVWYSVTRIPLRGDQYYGGYRLEESLVHWLISWTEYEISRHIYESQVVQSSPGQILSGGNMRLSGGELVNDKSQIIAGGTISGDVSIENIEAEGIRLVEEVGQKRWSSPDHALFDCMGGEGCGNRIYFRDWGDWQPHEATETVGTFSLPAAKLAGNQSVSGSGSQIVEREHTSLDGSAQGAGGARVDFQSRDSSGRIIEVPAIISSGAAVDVNSRRGDLALAHASAIERQAVASLPTPNEIIRTQIPSVRLPSNSLFQVRPEPTARFLVETDPRFTDRRQWLSSDYLFDALNTDPSVTQKRLGDGFYEQRLVREQITQLTGYRFLGDQRNDDAQYRALMNAGITFAEQYDLRPGVALTAEQMARLTSDIVWLVEQDVTLADGSTARVLVPQVYVRVREGDLKGDGTLIAGNVLDLDVTGDIVNSGALAGRELVSLTADNLANLGGRIAGNRVDLAARTDLANLGGTIEARDSLALQAGRDLTMASTSERLAGLYVSNPDGQLLAGAGRDLSIVGAELHSAGNLQLAAGRDLSIASSLDSQSRRLWRGHTSNVAIEQQATLVAGQDLSLSAGRDLGLAAVDITAGGDGRLSAGRDLTLETLVTERDDRLVSRIVQASQDVGTRLDIGGDLALIAGQDLYSRAAQLTAQGDLALAAGRDIHLDAGESRQYEEQRRGGTHTLDSHTRVLGSDLTAGGNLTLSAGENLRLTASRVQAGGDATLVAGRDLALLSAQEEDYSLYESKSGGGLFGSKRYQRDEVHELRAVGSTLASGGDLTLLSGGDQTYQGARLAAGGDLGLTSGGAIRFEAASDLRSESHEKSKSNFAWQSSSGEGFTRETLRQSELVAQGAVAIRAAEGIAIEVPEIDEHSVRQTIDAMVAADPDLAWLKAMEERGDIDWRQVKAIHDSWDYEQSGLGGGVALVVAVVAAATGQYYALAALEGATAAAAVVAAAGATAGSLAGTAAVSLINNRGDLGDTFDDTFSSDSLRSAAIAALSAGATQGITDRAWGTTTNTTTGATRNLNLSFGNGSDIARFAGQRATQATIDAGIRSAIDGGSFRDHLGDSLENAVTHVVSGVLFHAVGDVSQGRFGNGSPEKIALHALAGGLAAEAMGGDFRSGALAAGANEALVEHLDATLGSDPKTRELLLVTASQLVGIVAAELTNGDVYQGAEIAAQATRYNYLRHDQVDAYVDELEGCVARGDCDEIQERFRALSIAQQDELIALCATDAEACAANYQDLVDDGELFREALDGLGGREIPWQIGLDAGPLLSQYMEAEAVVSQEGFAQFLQERHGLDHEQASVLSAMAAGAVGLGATTSISSRALRAQLTAQEISKGHAFEKHVLTQGEFQGLGIRTREQFSSHIENVINNPSSVRYYRDGRTVYLDENTKTVVVRNPTAEGTAFRPLDWGEYISGLPSRRTPY